MKYIAINIIIFVSIATNFDSRVDIFSEVWNVEFCRRKYFSPQISSHMFLVISGFNTISLLRTSFSSENISQNKVIARNLNLKKGFTVIEIYIHFLLDLCPGHCRVLIFDKVFSLIVWRALCSFWLGVNFRSHLQDLSPLFLWCLESVRFF